MTYAGSRAMLITDTSLSTHHINLGFISAIYSKTPPTAITAIAITRPGGSDASDTNGSIPGQFQNKYSLEATRQNWAGLCVSWHMYSQVF